MEGNLSLWVGTLNGLQEVKDRASLLYFSPLTRGWRYRARKRCTKDL